MTRFIVQRLLLTVLVVFGVSFIVFTILSLSPSDPGRLILGQAAPQDAVDALNDELGYNLPFFSRYVKYIRDAVTRLDFGTSYVTREPVFTEIMTRFPKTLRLAFFGVIISSLLGVPLGIFSAIKQYSPADTFFTVTAMLLASVPGFWLGMMLVLIFSLWLDLLPSYGATGWQNYVLPLVTIVLPSSASLLRLTRSTMLETIRQDYIRTAMAKGVTDKAVIFNHALKNALLPIITIMGMNFGGLLGGTSLVEQGFSIPGRGMLVVSAIRMKDIPQVMAATIFLATLFCLIMLIVDILYAFVDPRIKAKFARAAARKVKSAI